MNKIKYSLIPLSLLCLVSVSFSLTQVIVVGHKQVSTSSSYWTDPAVTYLVALMDESTNASGDALNNVTGADAFTNMPTPATGPTYTILGTNRFGDTQHGWVYNGVNQYTKGPNTSNFTLRVGVPATIIAWYSNSASADYGIIGKDSGGGSTREWLLYKSSTQNRTALYIDQNGGSGYLSAIENAGNRGTNVWVGIAYTWTGSTNGGIASYCVTNLNDACVSNSLTVSGGTTNTPTTVEPFGMGGRSGFLYMYGALDFVALYQGTNLTLLECSNVLVHTRPFGTNANDRSHSGGQY